MGRKLMAVLTVTGFFGLTFLVQGMRYVQHEGRAVRTIILWMWIFVYGLVGTQMAWTLRPFFGAPDLPFQLFRQFGGNFYVDVMNSFWMLLSGLLR